MEIDLTNEEKDILRKSLNRLIDDEGDSVCYDELYEKLELDIDSNSCSCGNDLGTEEEQRNKLCNECR